jgi:hypothetical protein
MRVALNSLRGSHRFSKGLWGMVHTINSFNLACSGHCVRERRGCEFFPPQGEVGGGLGQKTKKKAPPLANEIFFGREFPATTSPQKKGGKRLTRTSGT